MLITLRCSYHYTKQRLISGGCNISIKHTYLRKPQHTNAHCTCAYTHRRKAAATLHATTKPQHQVQRALLLNVVVGQRAPVLQLLARKDQALLVRRDACTPTDPSESVHNGTLSHYNEWDSADKQHTQAAHGKDSYSKHTTHQVSYPTNST